MKVLIYSKEVMEKMINSNKAQKVFKNAVVISIYKTEDDKVEFPLTDKKVFYLNERCCDNPEDIKQMAIFINIAFKKNIDIICQDIDGATKSAAISAAITQYFFYTGIEIFSDIRYQPDKALYNELFAALKDVVRGRKYTGIVLDELTERRQRLEKAFYSMGEEMEESRKFNASEFLKIFKEIWRYFADKYPYNDEYMIDCRDLTLIRYLWLSSVETAIQTDMYTMDEPYDIGWAEGICQALARGLYDRFQHCSLDGSVAPYGYLDGNKGNPKFAKIIVQSYYGGYDELELDDVDKYYHERFINYLADDEGCEFIRNLRYENIPLYGFSESEMKEIILEDRDLSELFKDDIERIFSDGGK